MSFIQSYCCYIFFHLSLCQQVNFSENKIDADAARALSDYISSPGCNIIKLIMRRSDIDDNEIDSFVLVSYSFFF